MTHAPYPRGLRIIASLLHATETCEAVLVGHPRHGTGPWAYICIESLPVLALTFDDMHDTAHRSNSHPSKPQDCSSRLLIYCCTWGLAGIQVKGSQMHKEDG